MLFRSAKEMRMRCDVGRGENDENKVNAVEFREPMDARVVRGSLISPVLETLAA